MKDTLISIEDLSDSKELLLMKPHHLLLVFTFIISGLLIAAAVWMSIGKMDIYATAGGLVRTDEAPSVLRVIDGGRALQVNMTDGQTVSKGDILLSFDEQAANTQLDNNNRDLDTLRQDIEILQLYRNSINDLKNYLDGNDTDKGRAYSLKVENFLMQRETALTQISEDEENTNLQRANAEQKLSSAKAALKQLQSEQAWLQLYQTSVENNSDMIGMDKTSDNYKAAYASMYQKYSAGLQSLETAKSQAQTNLDKVTQLFEMGTVSRKDLDDAKNASDDADNNIKSYRQTELSNIGTQLADMATNINNAQQNINSAQSDVDLYSMTKTSPMMQVEQAKVDLLTQIDGDIQQKNDSIDALNANNDSLNAQLAGSVLTAPIDGILNLNSVYNEGDIISPGTEIGVITPPNSDSFRVTLQVGNQDIAGIYINQPVKFKFLALPYQEYGMVDGYVSQISADSRIDAQTGASYYSVEAVIENKPIKSYRGADESIKVGMAVEGRIIKEQKTILNWLLEKIHFE